MFTKKIKILRQDGTEFLSDCRATESAWERMAGLLPRSSLADGEGLWIEPCTSIHTFFMRVTIDVIFLDRAGRVIAVYDSLKPWRHSFIHFFAAGALETTAGAAARAGIAKGEVLRVCPSS